MKGEAATPRSLDISNRDAFYRAVLDNLNALNIPYLVGGGHAFELYSALGRNTKDLDLFVRPADVKLILAEFVAAGYKTELSFPHWLGKIFCAQHFIDVIFSSGNGVCAVDNGWFEHSVAGEFLGLSVMFCPPEEMIWTKSFVMERERYDGADVVHLLRACAARIDWHRLLARFGPHWRVLFGHLILFGYIYPSDRSLVPSWLMVELLDRLGAESVEAASASRICRGTLLSRNQYRGDVEMWGYIDARHLPHGSMTAEDAKNWTAAADLRAK